MTYRAGRWSQGRLPEVPAAEAQRRSRDLSKGRRARSRWEPEWGGKLWKERVCMKGAEGGPASGWTGLQGTDIEWGGQMADKAKAGHLRSARKPDAQGGQRATGLVGFASRRKKLLPGPKDFLPWCPAVPPRPPLTPFHLRAPTCVASPPG